MGGGVKPKGVKDLRKTRVFYNVFGVAMVGSEHQADMEGGQGESGMAGRRKNRFEEVESQSLKDLVET
eukprot:755419-Hanusia_phi.AAC.1